MQSLGEVMRCLYPCRNQFNQEKADLITFWQDHFQQKKKHALSFKSSGGEIIKWLTACVRIEENMTRFCGFIAKSVIFCPRFWILWHWIMMMSSPNKNLTYSRACALNGCYFKLNDTIFWSRSPANHLDHKWQGQPKEGYHLSEALAVTPNRLDVEKTKLSN